MICDVIEVEWVCAGQPHPFADSVYEAYITWRREDALLPDSRGRTAYYIYQVGASHRQDA